MLRMPARGRVDLGWIAPAATGLLAPAATGLLFAVLAIGVTIGEQARTPGARPVDALGIVLLLGATLPVAVARWWPVPAYLVATVSVGTFLALGYPTTSPYFLGVLVTSYQAAAPGHRSRSALLAALAIPTYAVGAAVHGQPDLLYVMVVMTAAGFVTGQVASELRAVSRRRDVEARVDEERRMLTEERLRIARELHDVISHSIATIGVQAGVAAHVLDEQPEQAREALLAIKAVSRDAMRDLRGMLGVLRESSDAAEDRSPQPRLAQLPELIERVRGAGVPVHLSISGVAYSLTPATDLAAYRVVQEALTNVIRHAPGASAAVRVRYMPAELHVEVTDDGSGIGEPGGGAGSGSGHGLIGLRERALALGGTLAAAPIDGGGFRVVACLPTDRGAANA
jgi:signal transduction histidine kinase